MLYKTTLMPTPPEIIATLRGNQDPDAIVLLQMADLGADLRKPHEPDFAFEVPEKSEAAALAKQLSALDFGVELYAPNDENPYFQIIAKKTMILALEVLNQYSDLFEALAERHHGSYDGWGAEIVE